MAGRRVPDHVWCHRPTRQSRHIGSASLDQPIHTEPCVGMAEPAEEHRGLGRAADDLFRQDSLRFRPERALAYLAALAVQCG